MEEFLFGNYDLLTLAILPFLLAGAGLAGAAASVYGTEKTASTNMQLAQYAYSKDLEMWNRQNEYNTPEAQMMRLKTAGLNPNMVYGTGTAGGLTSGQMPKYNAPTVQYHYENPLGSVPDVLSRYQDFEMKNAQIDNIRAQRKAIEATTANREITNQLLQPELPLAEQNALAKFRGRESKYILQDRQQQLTHQKVQMNQQSWPYQLESIKQGARRGDLENQMLLKSMSKLELGMQFQKLQNEYYTTKLFGDLGLKAAGAVSKFIPGVKGLPSLNNKQRRSADKWDQFEKARGRNFNP